MSELPRQQKGRIAIVSHQHPSVSKGGAEISAHTLFRGLLELGEDAIFIAACDESNRGRLHLESDREFIVFHDVSTYDHLYHAAMPEVTDALRDIFVREDVRLANFHHWIYLGLDVLDMATTELGVPSFLTLHEFLAICHNHGQMVTRPARVLCDRESPLACGECFPEARRMQFVVRREHFQRHLNLMKGWISPSEFLAHRFVDWGLDRERMRVIENGLMAHDGTVRTPRPHRPGSRWTVGYFGQINEFKGVDVLLKACAIIAQDPALASSVQIEINGNIVGFPDFAERVAAAQQTYPFLAYRGPYTNQSVSRLMRNCDYVVMLSTWWENSPVVIQEAFASGLPVICPNVGGMAEKVQDGVSGLHFLPNDPADLVRALREAMQPTMHEELVKGLPQPSTAREMARRYLDVFDEALMERVQPG
ncbi:glycosyltransferase family 4 protein [Sabulicella glaciei]|uniref:Glycosyltransferase family 4 protein n=1 Tax=Sabulicella glaciei TaxID=2984948 RepID=A0ABT3NVF6_9PROT|nr:glycosyltransferase family 4 protein [Roseococcus sp. MDT2-1-1]MCW8086137.1 glycosyltransferase family 4 protein [Roseococcus sp. MDT2-1-1]